jgi:NAD(P) transhydrogenase subunit alpha
MILGTVKETYPGERRVALVPAVLPALTKVGHEIIIEAGAGAAAGYPDDEYKSKGAKIVSSRAEVFQAADAILQVRAYGANPEQGAADLQLMREGQVLFGNFEPLTAGDQVKAVADKKVTLFAMEMIPRITRAQSMDVLSSMATIAGYKAVLLAAERLPKMFPMMMTAAGTLKPAKVFVVGAGVAGLQAIASSRRLGAQVEAYDVRSEVKEQIESLGAKFVEFNLDTGDAQDAGGYAKALGEEFYRRQREEMGKVVAENDVVITTAAVPGKKAPVLITADMVRGMARGSVIVDLAAERGGNCELTESGKDVDVDGVTIVGPENIPATVPYHASQMYAKNVANLIVSLTKEGNLEFDPEDEVVAGTMVTQGGQVVNPRVRESLGMASEATT